MPTTSRPGMGASMRIVRAARAIARSSASASMRDSLMRASGLTSYCVTTGPVLVATTVAGIWKRGQLLLDDADVALVVEMLAADGGCGDVEQLVRRQLPVALRLARGVPSSPNLQCWRWGPRAALAAAGDPVAVAFQTVWLIGARLGSGDSEAGRAASTSAAAFSRVALPRRSCHARRSARPPPPSGARWRPRLSPAPASPGRWR